MIENLSKEQIEGVFDALPVDFLFVDEDDRLQHWNKTETRKRRAPVEVLGKDIRDCHTAEALPMLEQVLAALKSGEKDEAGFWMPGEKRGLFNRFVAVRDESGKYLGLLQYLLDFTAMEELRQSLKRWPPKIADK